MVYNADLLTPLGMGQRMREAISCRLLQSWGWDWGIGFGAKDWEWRYEDFIAASLASRAVYIIFKNQYPDATGQDPTVNFLPILYLYWIPFHFLYFGPEKSLLFPPGLQRNYRVNIKYFFWFSGYLSPFSPVQSHQNLCYLGLFWLECNIPQLWELCETQGNKMCKSCKTQKLFLGTATALESCCLWAILNLLLYVVSEIWILFFLNIFCKFACYAVFLMRA